MKLRADENAFELHCMRAVSQMRRFKVCKPLSRFWRTCAVKKRGGA